MSSLFIGQCHMKTVNLSVVGCYGIKLEGFGSLGCVVMCTAPFADVYIYELNSLVCHLRVMLLCAGCPGFTF